MRVPGSTGVLALTPPTNEPGGHENGLFSKSAARHALLSVVRRETSCLGSCTSTDLTFESSEGIFSVVSRLAPLAFETFAELVAVNDGLNARALQLATWNGDLAEAVELSLLPGTNPVTELSVVSARAVGRVPHEALLGDGHDDLADPDRHALDDPRQRAGHDHLSGVLAGR